MRSSLLSSVTSLLAVFVVSSVALRAVPQQQCASVCGNVTSTTAHDIVCSDSDFANTPVGQAFQSCLTCQINSTANDPNTGESDLRWALFNMRFALSMCLWGYPVNSSVITTPCVTNPACGRYQAGIESGSLLPGTAEYDYCGVFNSISSDTQYKCVVCLEQQSTYYYMSNFFTALVAACQQLPAAGSTLSLAGSLFAETALTITTPSPSSSAASYAPSSNAPSLGTTVGATVGTIVFILIVLGICIICWGKRRRRAELERISKCKADVAEVSSVRPLTEPKWKQKSTVTGGAWGPDESPSTAGGWGSDSTTYGFSPYSSRYDSPVSARDVLNPKQTWEWPGSRGTTSTVEKRNFSPYTSPSSAHDAQGPKQDWDRAEAIELDKVAMTDGKLEAADDSEKDAVIPAKHGGLVTAPVIKVPHREKVHE